MKRVFVMVRSLASFVLMVGLSLGFIELAARALHWGVRPIIPAVQDALGHYRMPGAFASRVSSAHHGPYTLCTSPQGLRISCAPEGGQQARILLVGDSQMLGWGLAWEHSIAGQLEALSRGPVQALAAPLNDIETIQPWLFDYLDDAGHQPQSLVLALNLGNDLDELYLQRATVTVPLFREVKNRLSAHSYAYLDVLVAKSKIAGFDRMWPPGTNPVVMALDASERMQLAMACVEAMRDIRARMPAKLHLAALLLPSDYQVDPAEFSKYRNAYATDDEFVRWERLVARKKARLDEIERTIASELQEAGIPVVLASSVLRAQPAREVFDRGSHHLTALGSRLVAHAVLGTLASAAPQGRQP